MQDFITTYLSTVTSDQHASWGMLTPVVPEGQRRLRKYQGLLASRSSATPHDITADPAGMTVSYGVDYVKTDGNESSDHVTLQLVRKARRTSSTTRRERPDPERGARPPDVVPG